MKEEYKGYNIEIDYDNNPIDPRKDDNLCTMLCNHKRYTLGDEHPKNIRDLYIHILDELNITKYNDDSTDGELLNALLINPNLIIQPLYLYDHSGISIATYKHGIHSSWDCGLVGYIYVTLDELRDEFNLADNDSKQEPNLTEEELLVKGKEILNAEVKEYNKYLTGNVYRHSITKSIKCEHCGHIEYEEIDSCGNYYLSEEELLIECKSIIDSLIKE